MRHPLLVLPLRSLYLVHILVLSPLDHLVQHGDLLAVVYHGLQLVMELAALSAPVDVVVTRYSGFPAAEFLFLEFRYEVGEGPVCLVS